LPSTSVRARDDGRASAGRRLRQRSKALHRCVCSNAPVGSCRRGLILAIAAAVCLATAPLAAAERVGWSEEAKYAGKPVMSYRVVSLTLAKSHWNARVSFRNLSKATIRVGNGFGVAFWTSRKATDLADAVGFASASSYSSTPPAMLKPGASWS